MEDRLDKLPVLLELGLCIIKNHTIEGLQRTKKGNLGPSQDSFNIVNKKQSSGNKTYFTALSWESKEEKEESIMEIKGLVLEKHRYAC